MRFVFRDFELGFNFGFVCLRWWLRLVELNLVVVELVFDECLFG